MTTVSTSAHPARASVRGVAADGVAWFAGVRARRVVEHVELPDGAARLARGGFWVVVGEFEGRVGAWRFAEVERLGAGVPGVPVEADDTWVGPEPGDWTTSLDREAYTDAVARARERIRAGDVYQVNVCRVLEAPLPRNGGDEPSAAALARRLARHNPAPYAGGIHVPGAGAPGAQAPDAKAADAGALGGADVPPVWVVSASPELFLRVADGTVTSGPIKGTATEPGGLSDKDRAENVMIADMVRNDLQRVCLPGTVEVSDLLALEHHPGLVHLVTTVRGTLRRDLRGGLLGDLRSGRTSTLGSGQSAAADGWAELLAATYPPASVSGTPKRSALDLIARLEPVPRGPYTGAFGWIDADAARAELAVGIRTFWWTGDDGGRLRFGTGAGITWGSDPAREWDETRLKASRLIGIADGTVER